VGAFQEKIRRSKSDAFFNGCIDSIPVCLAFMFMFFSIGVLLASAGFSLTQSAVSRSKCNTSCKVLPCLPNTTT
jgi:hypothetical protein